MEIEVLKQVKYRVLKGEKKTQRSWREGGKLLFFSTWSRILTAHPWELVCLRSESFHAADTISARTPKPLEQEVEFCVLLTVILSLVGHVVREKALLSQVCLQLLFALFIIHAVCFSVFLFFLAEKNNSSSRCVNCPLAGAGCWPLASSRWPSWSYYHRQQNQNQSLGNEASRAPHPRQILIRKIVFEFAGWIFNAQERTRALPWGTLRMSTKGLETEFEDSNGI